MRENLPQLDQFSELAALSSLDLLTEREQRAFDRLIEDDHAERSKELKSFQSVVSLIGLGAPEIAPPPALREKLLAALVQTTKK